MHSRIYVILLVLLGSCRGEYPEGRLRCDTAAQCPARWFCERPGTSEARYCYRQRLARGAAGDDTSGPQPGPEGGLSLDAATDADAGPDKPKDSGAPPRDAAVSGDAEVTRPFEASELEPGDGEVIVKNDMPLSVTFSAPLDSRTVTKDSFVVTAPDGERVVGVFDYEANRAIFFRSGRWMLSGKYSVELRGDIKDRMGRALAPTRYSFVMRAGTFSAQLLGEADTTSETGPILSVTKESGAAVGVWSFHSEPRVVTSLFYRYRGMAKWEASSAIEGSLHGMMLNAKDRIALTTSVGVSLFDTNDAERFREPLLQTTVRKAFLTDSDELHILTSNGTQDLVQLSRTVTVEAKSEYPHALNVRPWEIDLAPLESSWYALWIERMRSASDLPDRVRVTDHVDCADGMSCPRVLSTPGLKAAAPSLGYHIPGKSLMAIWCEYENDKPSVHVSRRTSSEQFWTDPLELSEPDEIAFQPRVGLDGHGNAVAIWLRTTDAGVRVMSALYDERTNHWSSPMNVSGESTHSAQHAELAVNSSGQAVAVWKESDETSDPPGLVVRGAHYVPGEGWSVLPTISTTSGVTSSEISVGMGRDGRAFAAWYESGSVWVGRYE